MFVNKSILYESVIEKSPNIFQRFKITSKSRPTNNTNEKKNQKGKSKTIYLRAVEKKEKNQSSQKIESRTSPNISSIFSLGVPFTKKSRGT